jgi:hypothetical protein
VQLEVAPVQALLLRLILSANAADANARTTKGKTKTFKVFLTLPPKLVLWFGSRQARGRTATRADPNQRLTTTNQSTQLKISGLPKYIYPKQEPKIL